MNQQRIITPLLILALFLTAVAAPPAAPASAAKKIKVSIKLSKKQLTISLPGSYKLKPTIKPAKAKITWKSSKPKIATVSSKGQITAKAIGTTTITATAHYKKVTKKASCKITVRKRPETAPVQPTNQPVNTPSPAPRSGDG